jgi:hypothetical protein
VAASKQWRSALPFLFAHSYSGWGIVDCFQSALHNDGKHVEDISMRLLMARLFSCDAPPSTAQWLSPHLILSRQ